MPPIYTKILPNSWHLAGCDLPTNPLLWQRYLKTLRSVLATQRLSLRYEIPAATNGAPPEVKYADSEDYFRAAPAFNRAVPDAQTILQSDHGWILGEEA